MIAQPSSLRSKSFRHKSLRSKSFKSRAAALIVGLFTLGLVAGCGAPAAPASTVPATGVSSAPQTRTVTDMADRQVTLPGEVTSIGTIGSVGAWN